MWQSFQSARSQRCCEKNPNYMIFKFVFLFLYFSQLHHKDENSGTKYQKCKNVAIIHSLVTFQINICTIKKSSSVISSPAGSFLVKIHCSLMSSIFHLEKEKTMATVWRRRRSSNPSLWTTVVEEAREEKTTIFGQEEDRTVKTTLLYPGQHHLGYTFISARV